ncbi:21941_t:CDS:2, partial [Dentiscutata erythropus]
TQSLSIISTTDISVVENVLEGYGFLLNQWYHIAYTLSEFEKRMKFYIDTSQIFRSQSIIFNYGQLYIGNNHIWDGITGQGEDPTKSTDERPNKFFYSLSIGFFLGMIASIGGFFIHRAIKRKEYREIPDSA